MDHSQENQPVRKPPPHLGDFTVLDEIGRGGMGVVYRARQESTGSLVALKVLASFVALDVESVMRFRREADAAGRLSHPGIVPVFAVGEEDGVYYFAMDLVEGPSLQELISNLRGNDPKDLLGSLAEETAVDQVYPGLQDHDSTAAPSAHRYARSCAALAAQVSNALVAAHEGKVIHRDIKPSNILLHPKGTPVLVDFGLARDELGGGLTRTGDAVGTPSYMAPEQACGHKDVDGRVDVYGLGATLYELLTLRPPFDGPHPGEIMRQILDTEPVPVRELNPGVPGELASIVHRCLEKDPNRRYPSMSALERDLAAFLAGRPIVARRVGGADRVRRWLHKHRRAATLYASSFGVVLSAAIAMGLISGGRTDRLGQEALEQARTHMEARRGDLMQEAYGRARALLGEERVRQARQQHIQSVFEKYYRAERFSFLREILDSLPQGYQDAEIEEMLVRMRGMGSLRLLGIEADSGAAVAVLSAARRDWDEFPTNGLLPGGEYLVRVDRPGLATVFQAVRVVRDQAVEMEVPTVVAREMPQGMVLAVGGTPGGIVAIDRAEMTGGAYFEFLRGLDDQQLQKEMLPVGWSRPFPPEGPEYPVAGLSFRQARTLAALRGRHLPSAAEYRLGAYGGLTSLTYPWGVGFDPAKVAADPDRLSRPLPSDSLGKGASPLGLVHVLGNVAEILGADRAGGMWLAGGHHLSEPRGEVLKRLERLADPDLARPYAGVRLARFLIPEDTVDATTAFRRRSGEALEMGRVAQLVHWRVDQTGTVSVEVQLPPARRARKELPDAIEGFLQLDQGGRLHRQLLPLRGLRMFRDAYLMQLPLWNVRDQAVTHVLALPAGCAVEDVSPPPDLVFRHEGEAHVVWEIPGGVPLTIPARIRFRRDGMLSASWPATQPVEAVVDRFFREVVGQRGRGLEPLLADGFRFEPYGWTRRELVGAGRSRLDQDTFSDWRLLDVTAVGSVVAAEVNVQWRPRARGGEIEVISDWVFQVFLERSAAGYQILRVEPAGSPDTGTIREGVYHHEALNTWVEPPEAVVMVRDQSAPVALQVTCLPLDNERLPGVDFTVLGHAAAAGGESRARILHMLSSGDISSRPGELDTGPRQQFIRGAPGTMGSLGDNKEWRFWDVRGEEYSRERWTLLEIGRRHFLIRARSRGGSRREADQRFQAAQDWFATMVQAVRIE